MQKTLNKILAWISKYEPAIIEQLAAPATDEQIESVELEIGRRLPDDYRLFLSQHNGDMAEPTFFGGGYAFLDCEDVLTYYDSDKDCISEQDEPVHLDYKEWKSLVGDGELAIFGPVVPYVSHPDWVPIMSMDGRVMRFIDFAPAPGGTPGQIIEVDVACRYWAVLAESFAIYLKQYLFSLEDIGYSGEFRYGIDSANDDLEELRSDIPEWLLEITAHDDSEFTEADRHDQIYRGYHPNLSELSSPNFPVEIPIFDLQTYKRSKIDSDYFEIVWEDSSGDYLAFVHHGVYDDIPSKIRPQRQGGFKVKLITEIDKREEPDDRKCYPGRDYWLEAVRVAFVELNADEKKQNETKSMWTRPRHLVGFFSLVVICGLTSYFMKLLGVNGFYIFPFLGLVGSCVLYIAVTKAVELEDILDDVDMKFSVVNYFALIGPVFIYSAVVLLVSFVVSRLG